MEVSFFINNDGVEVRVVSTRVSMGRTILLYFW
jgi:hypothetical protein